MQDSQSTRSAVRCIFEEPLYSPLGYAGLCCGLHVKTEEPTIPKEKDFVQKTTTLDHDFDKDRQIVCELTDKLDELSKKEEELKKYGHG